MCCSPGRRRVALAVAILVLVGVPGVEVGLIGTATAFGHHGGGPCIPGPGGGCISPPNPPPEPDPTPEPTPEPTATPAPSTPTPTPEPTTPTPAPPGTPTGPPQNPGAGGPGAPTTPPGNVSVPGNATGGGAVFPSPEEWAEDTAEWIVESVSAGIETFVDTFNRVIFGLPTPGTWEDPDTWVDPDNGWWPGVWETYLIFVPIGVVMGVAAATLAFAKPPAERRQRFLTAAKALAFIVFGFPFLAAVLHLGNALAIALAPAPEEFMATPGSTAKLGVGVVLGVAVILVDVTIVILGLAILFIQYFLVHILVALWPLFWGLRALPFDITRPFGDVGVAGLGVLILLKIFQTATLRFLFEIPWDAGQPGALLFSLVGTIVGLLVATLVLPVVAVKKVLPAAMIAVGTTHSPSSDRVRNLQQRAASGARDRASGVLGRGNGGSGGGGASTSTTDRRQVGQVQRRVASYSRPGGRAGSATRSPQIGPAGQANRGPPERDNRGYR